MPDSPRLRVVCGGSFVSIQSMRRLRQLIAEHGPILVIDAASAVIQVGWLDSASKMEWAISSEESGVGIYECIEKLGREPREAAAFVFCDGPGSVLGVRTSAMAIRTWNVVRTRPAFAFHSLSAVAHVLGRPEITVISDARRETWHSSAVDRPLLRLPAAELTGELVMPDGFRHWSTLPPAVTRVPYSLSEMFPQLLDAPIMRESDAPDAFLHEEPSYATWTPQIHRAP